MLLVFTANENNYNSVLSNHFGRANYFVFYNTDTRKFEIISNPSKNTIGAAGIQAAQYLISKNVDIVITGHIGDNAIRFLSLAQIKIISKVSGNIKSFIKKFNPSNQVEQTKLEGVNNS